MKIKKSLYEQVYEELKADILTGKFAAGERLPSKRAAAERYGVSVVTAENAYSQLMAEGYITSRERSGYFAAEMPQEVFFPAEAPELSQTEQLSEISDSDSRKSSPFPFSVWTRLMRTVILEKGNGILNPVPPGGAAELRSAISWYLHSCRGIDVPPQRIIVGAGTEYLHNLLVQLLGNKLTYGVENPGYTKPARIYRINGALCVPISLDDKGIIPEQLYYGNIDAAHISPAHHFPTGTVMPISRRLELLQWASRRGGFIIEDDYDSEFRWSGKPLPTIFGQDKSERVIYMNTFSMTIAPSVRIGYICLPPQLYEQWKNTLSFCSCPVPVFEQLTLAEFISRGHFERHINRMKRHYRRVGELTLALAERYGCTNAGRQPAAGLHFPARIPESSPLPDIFSQCGVKLTPLCDCYDKASPIPDDIEDVFVVNYSSADTEQLELFLSKERT